MAISLSAAAHGVFAAAPSLTNRSGRFEVMYDKAGSFHDNVNDNEPAQCQARVDAKLSPRNSISPRVPKSSMTVDHEPDAEPLPLESPRSTEPSREIEKRHGEEVRSLTAQLMDAKEQVERFKTTQQKLNADVASERKARKEAEDLNAKLQSKCHSQEQSLSKLRNDKSRLCKENAGLEKKVHHLRKALGSKGNAHSNSSLSSDFDRLAVDLAEAECAPLKRCTLEEKAALKKKLLLKWHPDKQPSAEHSNFATRVLQEMQNHAAWHD